jgi:hypothetical protein
MIRYFTLLLLLAGSLLATSFTATTFSGGGAPCSHVNLPDPTTRSGGSGGPGFFGSVMTSVGFGFPGSMALATLTFSAHSIWHRRCGIGPGDPRASGNTRSLGV